MKKVLLSILMSYTCISIAATEADKSKPILLFSFSSAVFNKLLEPIDSYIKKSSDGPVIVPVYLKKNGCLVYGWWNDDMENIPSGSAMSKLSTRVEEDKNGLFLTISMIPDRMLLKTVPGPQYFKYVGCYIKRNTTISELERMLDGVISFNK